MHVPAIEEEALIDEVQQRLAQKYAHLPRDDVSAAVQAALTRFERSSIRDFVPLLVERRASVQLSTQHGLPPAVESQPAII
jgi:hypothetical protein